MSSKPYFNVEVHAQTPYTSTGQLTLVNQAETQNVFNSNEKEDCTDAKNTEAVLAAKGRLVTQALDEIGWTNFHLKLFCFSGIGISIGTMVAMLQSIVAHQSFAEFGHKGYPTGLVLGFYTGQLTGALFWGFGADILGRATAFKITSFIVALATMVAGAAPNWISLGVFVSIIGFAAGGNAVLDPAVFLEFLPSTKKWAMVLMPIWWGIGQATAGFIAWGYFCK